MKLYLQILIIGILIFSSKQYTCKISEESNENDGFYNAPIGAYGICTNTGVCQGSFSETANQPASKDTLTGDCFHCKQANRFLNRDQSVSFVRCSRNCQSGYTDKSTGQAASSPLKANCQYCIKGLVKRNGVCECQNKFEYLTNTYSGSCGRQCDQGYVQYRNGVHLSAQFTHCLYCHYGLENKNGACACATNGQYLTKSGYGICGNQCHTNFTHNSDGSAPDSTITGHCFTCLSTHTYYRRNCSLSCPSGQYYTSIKSNCGKSCEPGYSDQPDGSPPQTPITDNCNFCQRGLRLTSKNFYCHCRVLSQYLTGIATECGENCLPGFTYNSDGRVPDSPATGHCVYCITGLEKKRNQCRCAIYGQYLTSRISNKCGTNCDDGYTHRVDGSAPNKPTYEHCLHCQEGFTENNNGACVK